jgi:hypothetical protein
LHSPVRHFPACNPRMERESLGHSSGFAPRDYSRRTLRRERALRTGSGPTPSTSSNLLGESHSSQATSCRTISSSHDATALTPQDRRRPPNNDDPAADRLSARGQGQRSHRIRATPFLVSSAGQRARTVLRCGPSEFRVSSAGSTTRPLSLGYTGTRRTRPPQSLVMSSMSEVSKTTGRC